MSPPTADLHMALRDGDWKLLASRDFNHLELYDLRSDPGETMDRKAQDRTVPGHAQSRLELLNSEVEREPAGGKRLGPNGGGPLSM